MMLQYRYQLTPSDSAVLPSHCAYRLYAALLEQLPPEPAQRLHANSGGAISQYVYTESGRSFWVITLLNADAAALLSAVLTDTLCLPLPRETVTARLQALLRLPDADAFADYEAQLENPYRLTFPVPAAFKQNGRYISLPREELILGNLWRKWNVVFPDAPIAQPPQAFMTDFRIHSASYGLKGVQIPGFCGQLRLAPEAGQAEELRKLTALARFTGVGIKTALGMGGVK